MSQALTSIDTARKSIGNSVRFDVLQQHNFSCRYCGAKAPEVRLEVDHIIPFSVGGPDIPGNYVAACARCNSGKSNKLIDAVTVVSALEVFDYQQLDEEGGLFALVSLIPDKDEPLSFSEWLSANKDGDDDRFIVEMILGLFDNSDGKILKSLSDYRGQYQPAFTVNSYLKKLGYGEVSDEYLTKCPIGNLLNLQNEVAKDWLNRNPDSSYRPSIFNAFMPPDRTVEVLVWA